MITRALVVQHRPGVAREVRAALAEAGVESLVVTDGFSAVETAAAWNPHVVLVDLTLPPLDGWYVVAALGGRTERPLLVVRVADASEAERAVALGADAWVDTDVHVVDAAGRLTSAIAA